MIYATKVYKTVLNAEKFGVDIDGAELNFKKVLEYTNKLVRDAINSNENQLEAI